MANKDKGERIRIMFRVEARRGQRDELIRFLKWDQEDSMNRGREPGTLCFDFFQDPDNKNGFYVYEAYKNAAAFKKHKKHKPYKRWSSSKFRREFIFPHRRLRRLGR